MDTKTLLTVEFQRKDCLSSQLDNEIILLDAQAGFYFGLNSVASEIWELLNSPKTIPEIGQILVNRYRVTAEECQEEVAAFINELLKHDLVCSC